jgi:hypothetical protein
LLFIKAIWPVSSTNRIFNLVEFNGPFPPETSLRRKNPAKNRPFPAKMPSNIRRIPTPSGNGRYRVPVADLPSIGLKYAGSEKTADMAIEIRGQMHGISEK